MYKYKAKVIKVVDGDSVHLEMDLGFDAYRNMKCRLYGINTPEIYKGTEEEKIKGQAAKVFVNEIIPAGTVVWVRSHKDRTEKYGRYLVTIYLSSDFKTKSINELLVDTGHAEPYMT